MLKTLEKEQAREFVRQYVTEHLEPLVAAQIDNAVGIRHLMMRDPKTGKFERVTMRSSWTKLSKRILRSGFLRKIRASRPLPTCSTAHSISLRNTRRSTATMVAL
jgi:hypothetical protein